ncbi:hypothetical protein O3M35_002060 [Rhynocoris fuscipes]|uniref:Uncharacterized protein n=1 Tax=Rhynocoris fuscipes TaxID=488301 RepID=A0AAW1CX81_9HEMI
MYSVKPICVRSLSCKTLLAYLTMSLMSCSVQAYCSTDIKPYGSYGPIGYGGYGVPAGPACPLPVPGPAYGLPYYQPHAAALGLQPPVPITSGPYCSPSRYYDPSCAVGPNYAASLYDPACYATAAGPNCGPLSGAYYSPNYYGNDCYYGKPQKQVIYSGPCSYPNTAVQSSYTSQPNCVYYDPCEQNTVTPSYQNNVIYPSNVYENVYPQRPAYASTSSSTSFNTNTGPNSSAFIINENENVNTATSQSSSDGTQLSMNTSKLSRRSTKNNRK